MRIRFACLVLAVIFFASNLSAQSAKAVAASARFSGKIDSNRRTKLEGSVPPFVNIGGTASEALPASFEISQAVMVLQRAPAVEAAFEQLLLDQLNPSSPHFHQWLTSQQVGEQYGPAQADLDAITSWLASQGLNVTGIAPNRLFVSFKGSTDAIAHAFSTRIRNYRFSDGETQYTAVEEPSIPEAIAPLVQSVQGLTQMVAYPASTATLVSALQQTSGTTLLGNTTPMGEHRLLAGDFNTIYNVKAAHAAGYTGAGVRVAVAGRSRINEADITSLEAYEGLPAKTPAVVLPNTGIDPGPASENYSASNPVNVDQDQITFDVGRIYGTAPGADVNIIATTGNTNANQAVLYRDWLTSAIGEATGGAYAVASIGYVVCEANSTAAYAAYMDQNFKSAAAQGVTIFVAAGNSGIAGCNPPGGVIPSAQTASINVLCSSAYVTCVGGTEFNDTASPSTYWNSTNDPVTRASALSYIPEGAWNEPVQGSNGSWTYGATTGGTSAYLAVPYWQASVAGESIGRVTPDISFAAAAHTGYLGFLAYRSANNAPVTFNGTSAAAASMAGIQALVNERLGGRQGNINPLLYRLGRYPSKGVFHDVTRTSSGATNCQVGTPSMCNNSTPSSAYLTGGLVGNLVADGWDPVTGWGSMDAYKYLTASVEPISTITNLMVSPNNFAVGVTATLTAKVTSSGGTPTGTVQFLENGKYKGWSATLVGDTATYQVTPSSNYSASITAVYMGDAAFAESTSPAATIQANTMGTVMVGTRPVVASLSAGSPAVIEITVGGSMEGDLSSSVTFYLDGLLTGTTTVDRNGIGEYSFPGSIIAAGKHTYRAVYAGNSLFVAAEGIASFTAYSGTDEMTLTPTAIQVGVQQTISYTVTLPVSATGTIEFNDAAYGGVNVVNTKFCSVMLVAGSASCSTGILAPGRHLITATYSGGSGHNYNIATATAIVAGYTTTTTLIPTKARVSVGEPAVLNIFVMSPNAGSITGSVNLFAVDSSGGQIDGDLNVQIPLVNGKGSYTVGTLAATPNGRSFRARYLGDTNYVMSTSPTATVVAKAIPSITTLTPVTTTVIAGEPVIFTATVTGSSGMISSGQVHFIDDANLDIGHNYVVNGVASISRSFAAGTRVIHAVYSGDSTYDGSTSSGSTVTGVLPSTITTVIPVSSAISRGASEVVNIAVTSTTTGTISGSATIYDGAAIIGSVTIAGGVGSFTIPASQLTIGTHNISAAFAGSTSYAASTSAASAITVNGLASAVVLAPATASINSTQTVTFSAAVSGLGATPAGTVTFSEGATALGSSSLSAGVAGLTSNTFSVGTHTITARYSGDSNFTPSTSNSSVITVTVPPTYAVSLNLASFTFPAGATAGNTAIISVTGSGGFTGTVLLTCSINSTVQNAPTCLLNPSSITNAGNSTLTINTQARTSSAGLFRNHELIFASVLLLVPFASRKKLRVLVLSIVFLSVALAGISGCGNSGGGSTPSPGTAGTPAGAYTVTVNATYGSMTQSTTANLTIN